MKRFFGNRRFLNVMACGSTECYIRWTCIQSIVVPPEGLPNPLILPTKYLESSKPIYLRTVVNPHQSDLSFLSCAVHPRSMTTPFSPCHDSPTYTISPTLQWYCHVLRLGPKSRVTCFVGLSYAHYVLPPSFSRSFSLPRAVIAWLRCSTARCHLHLPLLATSPRYPNRKFLSLGVTR